MSLLHPKYQLMIALTATLVLMVITAIYMSVFDGRFVLPVLHFSNNPYAVEVDKAVYAPGETVYGYYDYCKLRVVPGSITWTLTDGETHFFDSKPIGTGKGCYTHKKFPLADIPLDMLPDTNVHLEGIASYKVNPVSIVSYPLKTVTFSVK